MSKFSYTLPSGSKFEVIGPADATQLQADLIFYQQVAAGALVGYTSGQTLTSVASQITKFELSRLDRGIAGVDTVSILAVISGLPIVSGIPALVDVPITNPINQANIVEVKNDTLGPDVVGPLTSFEVQALVAQIANIVDQPYDEASQEKGIGQYGLTSSQLERTGYVKPGVEDKYIKDNPDKFLCTMKTPTVWTGKNGINSLGDLLSDRNKQTDIQVALMQQGYQALLGAGVITNPTTPPVSLSTGQVYTQGGLQTVSPLTLLGVNASSLSQSSVNLNTIISGAVNNIASATGLNNLTISSAAAATTKQITGDIGALVTNASKFGAPLTTLWSSTGGLGSVSALATGTINTVTSSVNSVNNIVGSLANPTSLSGLTSNLNQFGKAAQSSLNFINPTAIVGNLQALGNASIAQAQAVASQLQGQATAALNSAQATATQLQGQATAALNSAQALAKQLGNLTSLGNLGSIFGGGGDLVSGTQLAAGFNNTVNRKTVDAAVTRILGSGKIPTPNFEYPSVDSLAQKLDITQAQNILKGLQGQVGTAIAQGKQIVGQATQLATTAQTTINRLV
jgi:hypothetical protein